jgi:hypothetical protein
MICSLNASNSARRATLLPGPFVGGGCDTAAMDTLSESPRHDVPRRLGKLPFTEAAASRSLWVVYVGAGRVWTHAVLPVDDRPGMPDADRIRGLCEIVAMSISPPLCRDDEEALVVLRRPGPAPVSEADAYIFRLVCEAAADRKTAPWTFYVAGPDGVRECFRQAGAGGAPYSARSTAQPTTGG